jgi:hypothetical protein
METLLVTKADFATYADLPESLDLDRLTPHILAVQLTRLRPLLTEPLHTELLRQVSVATVAAPLPAQWASLLAQVVPVVCRASLARYMPFSQNTFTSHSLVQKTSQYSQPVEGRDLARMASIYDGDALTHEVALTAWLKANAASFVGFYPQATDCCGEGQPTRIPSVVVQGIRRPDDRPSSSIPYGR